VLSVADGQLLAVLEAPGFSFFDVVFDISTHDLFLQESSFCYPFSLWHIDGTTIQDSQTRCPEARPLKLFLGASREETPLSTRRVFYTSSDGAKIPMFLTSEDSNPVTAQTPILLYVYSGFGISVIPHFRPEFLAFMQAFRGVPYKLAYELPLCGPCEPIYLLWKGALTKGGRICQI
jgi:prolyl oligopeptidase